MRTTENQKFNNFFEYDYSCTIGRGYNYSIVIKGNS